MIYLTVNMAWHSLKNSKKMCEKVGSEWLSFEVFDGKHEFLKTMSLYKNW